MEREEGQTHQAHVTEQSLTWGCESQTQTYRGSSLSGRLFTARYQPPGGVKNTQHDSFISVEERNGEPEDLEYVRCLHQSARSWYWHDVCANTWAELFTQKLLWVCRRVNRLLPPDTHPCEVPVRTNTHKYSLNPLFKNTQTTPGNRIGRFREYICIYMLEYLFCSDSQLVLQSESNCSLYIIPIDVLYN